MSSNTDEYDDWYFTEYSTGTQPITSDEFECDECVEDDYSESASQIENPPLDSDGFSFTS